MKSRPTSETVDEIVDFILIHEGPDLDRRAHHKKKRVRYADLDAALSRIHQEGLLLDLKDYHFNYILNIWSADRRNGNPLGREMTGLLIERLKRRYGSLIEVIKNIKKDDFHNEEFEFKNKDGVVKYNPIQMLQYVYANSPSTAVTDWLQNNPDEEVRKEYAGIKPWHFARVPLNTWKGEEGKKNGRELTGQLIERLKRRYGSLIEVIKNIKQDDFLNEQFEFKNKDGVIEYKLGQMLLSDYAGSPTAAVTDWLQNNPDEEIRKEYAGIKPWHFGMAPKNTWQGEEGKKNGRELTGQLIERLKQRYGSLIEVIKNIKQDDFHNEQFEFKNKDGVISYDLEQMLLRVYADSPSAAITDWLQNNPDEEIRKAYAGIKPWHFGKTTQGSWKGEEGKKNGRELTGQLIERLKQRYGSFIEVIKKIKQDDFHNEEFEFKNKEGIIRYNLWSMLTYVYANSPSTAVTDWLQSNPDEEIRKEYVGIRPWHFGMVPQGTWKGKDGKKNGRELTGQLIERLKQRYGSFIEVIKNIKQDDFLNEQLEFKNKDGIIRYNLWSMLTCVYAHSPSTAVMDWIQNNPNEEISKEYAGIRPWHFGMAPLNTWRGEEGKKNGRELTGKLIGRLTQRYGSLIEVIKNIRLDDFHNEQFEFKNKEGGIEYNLLSMLGYVYANSPSAAITDWLQSNPDEEIRKEYAGIRPWHFGMAPKNTWQGEEGKKNGRELTGLLIERLKQRYGSLIEVIKNIRQNDFHDEQFEFKNRDGVIRYNLESMVVIVYTSSPSAAVMDWVKHQPKHIKEKYSFVRPIHFIGSTETRGRRLTGKFSAYDLSKIKKQKTYDTSIFGFTQYHSSDKGAIRDIMAEEASKVLGDTSIAYLGLETERFQSLLSVYELLNLDSFSSTIIERAIRVYNAMKAVQQRKMHGKALKGIEIIHNSLDKEVSQMHDRKYNYVNYDFTGHLSQDKERAIGALFENNLLADTAVIYITLQETELSKERAKRAGFEDQVKALNQMMQSYAKTHSCEQMFTLDYQGGTSERKMTPMIVMGYKVRKCQAT
ncbi:MAG: hypothetical protein Q7J54_07400 [Candidatus Woesearchaeota archaeon]|nr:hypothetical protein [Candidatus Woesearchaeota archaeon]